MTLTLTYSREQIDRALAKGHQHNARERGHRSGEIRMKAPRMRREEPTDANWVRRDRQKLADRIQNDANRRFKEAAELRNRERANREIASRSDAPEEHPELTAQTIEGCQVYFNEQDEYVEPVTPREWWNMIAKGDYA